MLRTWSRTRWTPLRCLCSARQKRGRRFLKMFVQTSSRTSKSSKGFAKRLRGPRDSFPTWHQLLVSSFGTSRKNSLDQGSPFVLSYAMHLTRTDVSSDNRHFEMSFFYFIYVMNFQRRSNFWNAVSEWKSSPPRRLVGGTVHVEPEYGVLPSQDYRERQNFLPFDDEEKRTRDGHNNPEPFFIQLVIWIVW